MITLEYPLWLRATHFFNFLLLSLLVRSGLEILSAHPRLYWNDHCTPGSEWLKFTKKQRPRDRLWAASDEESSFPSAIALPGHEGPHLTRALLVWLSGLTGILIIHVVTTVCSRRRPRFVQKATQSITDPLRTLLFGHEISTQHYSHADISPYFWVNGRPPKQESYLAMAREQFANYSLEVSGLVERPLRLTLTDIRTMPKQTQITKHCCIQDWSGVAKWGGVSLHHILGLCHPLPAARYIAFYAFDNKSTSEPHAQGPGYFYGTIGLELAEDPQTILAYEMNGQPLPILHGAPLRLRVETQLGFAMVKYIRAIEFIEDYKTIGQGQGGWREDYQYFSQEAGI